MSFAVHRPSSTRSVRHGVALQRSDALAIPALALLFAWPAIYNGYPMIFSDSGEYLYFALTPRQAAQGHAGYPIFYSLAILPFVRLWPLWTVVAAQATLCCIVLRIWTGLFFANGARGFWITGIL